MTFVIHRFTSSLLPLALIAAFSVTAACGDGSDETDVTGGVDSGTGTVSGAATGSATQSSHTEDDTAGDDRSGDDADTGGVEDALWRVIDLPPGREATRLAGDTRGVWLAERNAESGWDRGAGRLNEDGYEQLYHRISDQATAPNYVIEIGAVDDRHGVVATAWSARVIGDQPFDFGLDTSTPGGTSAVYARSRSELWTVGSYGSLRLDDGSTTSSWGLTTVGGSGGPRGIWATDDTLLYATDGGLGRAALPLGATDTVVGEIEVEGDFFSLSGTVDGWAMAVGAEGAIVRWSANSFQSLESPWATDWALVAVYGNGEAWLTDGSRLVHFDGDDFVELPDEEGSPTGGWTGLAVGPDDALWVISAGAVFRRAPEPVGALD